MHSLVHLFSSALSSVASLVGYVQLTAPLLVATQPVMQPFSQEANENFGTGLTGFLVSVSSSNGLDIGLHVHVVADSFLNF